MLYLRLAGGLGNQLFQIAAAINFKKNSQFNDIFININSIKSYSSVHQLLINDLFDFDDLYVNPSLVGSLSSFLRLGKFVPYYSINDLNFHKKLESPPRMIAFLDGYFQHKLNQEYLNYSVSYFRNRLKISCINENIASIHIRGGDFLLHKNHNILTEDYYKRSINYLRYKHNVNIFYVITDDLCYAKSLLGNFNQEIFNFKYLNGIDSFKYLVSSKYLILSNSTFCWWAAILNKNLIECIGPEIYDLKGLRPPIIYCEKVIPI
jgi:hypothetical protein